MAFNFHIYFKIFRLKLLENYLFFIFNYFIKKSNSYKGEENPSGKQIQQKKKIFIHARHIV